jgi:hypothetical protein
MQRIPALKHSQYSFRHLEREQLQPFFFLFGVFC